MQHGAGLGEILYVCSTEISKSDVNASCYVNKHQEFQSPKIDLVTSVCIHGLFRIERSQIEKYLQRIAIHEFFNLYHTVSLILG